MSATGLTEALNTTGAEAGCRRCAGPWNRAGSPVTMSHGSASKYAVEVRRTTWTECVARRRIYLVRSHLLPSGQPDPTRGIPMSGGGVPTAADLVGQFKLRDLAGQSVDFLPSRVRCCCELSPSSGPAVWSRAVHTVTSVS